MTTTSAEVKRLAEHIWEIRSRDTVFVKIRNTYKTMGKGTNANTEIKHTIIGGDVEPVGYVDSDGKSMQGVPLTAEDQEIPFTHIQAQKGVTFGIFGISTSLKENDIYWIQIEARTKGLVKKEGNMYRLQIEFINEEKDDVVFQVKVPSTPEGIVKHTQTIIKSLVPSPSLVYDEKDFKVFQWNLGSRRNQEKDRFDVVYTLRSTYNPLVKYLVSGFIGGVIGTLITLVAERMSPF
jgi:hypothetical protein